METLFTGSSGEGRFRLGLYMSASWEKGGMWGADTSPSTSRPLPLMLILGMLRDVSTLMSGRPEVAADAVAQKLLLNCLLTQSTLFPSIIKQPEDVERDN